MTTGGRVRAQLKAVGRGLPAAGLALAGAAVSCAVTLAVLLMPLGVGLYLLPPAANALRELADLARRWARNWSGVAIGEPPPRRARPGSGLGSAAQRSVEILAEPAFWRESAWALLDWVSGAVLALVPFSLILYGVFGAVVQPFVWRSIERAGGGNWYAFVHVHTAATAMLAVPVAVAFTVFGLWSAPWWLGRQARLNRFVLAPGRTELAQRVRSLSDARAALTDSSAAELRRIERDLHDGAQARLVVLGMTLDSARRTLARDPAAADRLIGEAREASSTALQEIRDLVRGIHPPVLADRGLPDAVRELALDNPLDVAVDADFTARLPRPVESAAYFAVSELLTNATKHAEASRISVLLRRSPGVLLAEVTDDGRGGAPHPPAAGGGLAGIAHRLAAFDGWLTVDSPPGGPTVVRMEIPCG